MNRYTRCLIFLAAFAVMTLTVLATLSGTLPPAQPDAVAQDTEPNDAPIALYRDEKSRGANDSQLSPERLAKNRRYDKAYTVEELPPGMTVTPRSGDWILKVPALPIAQSDAVIIGHVIGAQAFLSNDQTGIYSEFTILVDDTLKGDTAHPFKNGELIIAERAGGAVQFPSGRIQRIQVYRGQRMPQVGDRYVLFLKRSEPDASPTILTGYKLQQSSVVPLDNVKPYSDYAGMDEPRFLSEVEAQAASSHSR